MENITRGHWIFAGIFFVVFICAMVYAYRKDLAKYGYHYSRVWVILLGIIILYFILMFLYRQN